MLIPPRYATQSTLDSGLLDLIFATIKLYDAGHWATPGLTEEQQKQHWQEVKDALLKAGCVDE